MRVLIAAIVVFGLWASLDAILIESTSVGGNWTQPSTWEGGVVPSPIDDVFVHGLVFVNAHVTVSNLLISETGSIMNSPGVNWTLTTTLNLIVEGSCEDNPSSGTLSTYVGNSLYVYGILNNGTLVMTNSTVGTIYHAPDAGPIACDSFNSWSGTAEYQLLSDLRFSGCMVDFYSHTVHMSYYGSDYAISLSGGRLYRAVLDTEGFAALSLSNGAYLYNVVADNINLFGTAPIYQGVSFVNLNNTAVVNAFTGGTYNLTVYEKLVNHGTITNSIGNVYLNLYGDLENYATISCYNLNFLGTGIQYVYQDPAAAPFNCHNFGKLTSSTGGSIVLKSDLRFLNTIVDTYYYDLVLHHEGVSYGLDLNGGQLYRTKLVTDGFSNLHTSNGAYLYYVNSGGVPGADLVLSGIVQSYGYVYFDDVVNTGTLRSYLGSQYTFINGNFTNWGSVSNAASANTYLCLRKNLFNYGTINCQQVLIDGTQDQYCQIGGSVSPSRFTLYSNIGPSTWYLDGIWQAQGSDYLDVNPYVFGVWQPMAATAGRHITLTGAGSAPGVPQNLAISEVNGFVLLTWNQVPGAAYYKLQSAITPGAGYSDLPELCYDGDLADGTVYKLLVPTAERAFYRVKAGN